MVHVVVLLIGGRKIHDGDQPQARSTVPKAHQFRSSKVRGLKRVNYNYNL